MTATPPDSFAIRSLILSLSYSDSVFSTSFLSFKILSFTSDLLSSKAMIVVLSFEIVIFFALPRSSIDTLSKDIDLSSLIKFPPVRIAISSRAAFLLSPNNGALTEQTFNTPAFLFITNAVNASPSISSARIRRADPAFWISSSIGTNELKFEIF